MKLKKVTALALAAAMALSLAACGSNQGLLLQQQGPGKLPDRRLAQKLLMEHPAIKWWSPIFRRREMRRSGRQ